MAQYDIAHIDIGQYRELKRLVQEGRVKAALVVVYPNTEAPPLLQTAVCVDAGQRQSDRICQNSKIYGVGGPA
jgi:hypothetical protein